VIGGRIKKFRSEKGWSQEQLAIRANVSIASVQKWEQDFCIPKGKNLWKLTAVLDCRMSELWDIEDELEPVA